MTTTSTPLHRTLTDALSAGEAGLEHLDALLRDVTPPMADRRDRARCLLAAYRLRSGPVSEASRLAHHPAIGYLRWHLERAWQQQLAADPPPDWLPPLHSLDPDAAAGWAQQAMRRLAARDRLPEVYQWVAKTASLDQLIAFLEFEGGPDAGFDDLVAACQIGLAGTAKMELAVNYWDEMGDGDPAAVHTDEHARMAHSLGLRQLSEDEQPVEGLERSALCGMLAANHWLQPEMLGALGLIELQAGPRCRLVVQGLHRVGAPAAAIPFYDIHAEVDPRHGRDWLEKAILPTVRERPDWAVRIVRGAWWRSRINDQFFTAVCTTLAVGAAPV